MTGSWLTVYQQFGGYRAYSYAELAVFFPGSGSNYRQYALRLTTEG